MSVAVCTSEMRDAQLSVQVGNTSVQAITTVIFERVWKCQQEAALRPEAESPLRQHGASLDPAEAGAQSSSRELEW